MMNKYKRIILLCCVVLFGGLSMYYSGGPANSGVAATGAPFNGGTCNSCHSGGSYSTTLTMQLLDGALNPVTTYTPGTAYTLRITKGGTSPRMGFQTTAAFQGTNANINTWGALPANTHNTSVSGHNYIEHGTQLNVSVVNIPWTAPSSTTTVVFYTALNAVNNDNGQGGDQVVSGSLIIPTGCATIDITPNTMPSGTANVAYSQSLSQTGGVGTVTYAVTIGLPPGTTLSPAGLLSGTPTTPGTYNFSVTATGSNGCSSTETITMVVNCPTVTLTPAAGSLPGGTVAAAYNQVISQTGGTGTYTYTVTAGSLPPGVTLNTNGTLSGTPLTAGTYNFTITGTNGTCPASAAYSIVIGCPTITLTPANPPNGTAGTGYNQVISQTGGGTGAYTYTLASGTLPTGLLLSTGGTISGTPSAPGVYNFSITATGTQSGCSVTQAFTITINCPTITVNPATLSNGTVGVAYTLSTITQTGGTNPTTYAVTSGTFPPGLNLATNGVLNGTPTTPGSYTFTITSTSQFGCTGTRTYTIVISCPTVTINPATLPNGTTGTAYSQTITQTGGTGVTYTVTSGTLPPGLTLALGGALTGTPTAAGSYTFTVTGTVGTSTCTGTRTYTIIISCPTITINPATLPTGNLSVAYSQNITQTGGTGTVTFTVTSGSLPAGVTLATNGLLSGTPTASGTFTFTVTATDANGCTGTITYNWVISPCAAITINPATLPNGTVGTAYSQTITQTGGTGTFTYTVTSGTLPPGLTLAAGGGLTGTPTTPGSYTFTITGTSGACSGSRTYTIVIACPAITINPATLPNGTPGTAYSQNITQTGGTGTFTYTVTSGTLPPGLTLNTNGTLSGTPTTPGTYTFTVTGTNGTCDGTRTYTLIINCPTITLAPATLPDGTTGTAYSQNVTQTGSLGSTFTYTVTSGTLPTGVTLATNGTLSGTPTAAGSYTFTITMTDDQGCTGTITYTINIVCPVITIDQTTVDTAFTASPYSETLTTTGGAAPYTYAVISGTLPAGITLGTNGVFSGTATATPGVYTVTIAVTDANGCIATQVIDIIVFDPLSVVSVNGNKESVILLPNVVADRTTARIISTVSGTAELRVLDITGKVVYNTTTNLKAGENNVNLDLRNLAAGSYTLHVRPLKVAPVKFIKQ